MNTFEFLDDPTSYKVPDAFVAHLSGTDGKESLLLECYTKLNLPDYFGFNWDVLYDCLTDFHWIEKREVVIVHNVIPTLNGSDLKIYLQILNYAIKDWEHDNVHRLQVVFPITGAALLSIQL